MGREVMALRHLRLANAIGPSSDVCWLVDFDNGCTERDNCIIDTS